MKKKVFPVILMLIALASAVLAPPGAMALQTLARPTTVVSSCGGLSLTPGQPAGDYVDTTGLKCTGIAAGTVQITPGSSPIPVSTNPLTYTATVPSLSDQGTSDLQITSHGELLVSQNGAANFTATQTSVSNTATSLVSARSSRRAVMCENHGTTDVFLGASNVTTSTGLLLPGVKGASVTVPTNAALYGIVASSTQTVSCLEIYQ